MCSDLEKTDVKGRLEAQLKGLGGWCAESRAQSCASGEVPSAWLLRLWHKWAIGRHNLLGEGEVKCHLLLAHSLCNGSPQSAWVLQTGMGLPRGRIDWHPAARAHSELRRHLQV